MARRDQQSCPYRSTKRSHNEVETMTTAAPTADTQNEVGARLCLQVRGAVQGVGFRPFVYRLATEIGLDGWVNNSPQGVSVEIEGSRAALDEFLLRFHTEKPPIASIEHAEAKFLAPVGYHGFEIRASVESGEKRALILPDLATCPDCLRELFDPSDRRYLYPFTNCTNCGPRFSIIEALPYDRPNTTMKVFPMCEECRTEYEDPLDRRFHAQPNACPRCGPHLELWSPGGQVVNSHHQALLAAAEAIRGGAIVAVKGLGGFHLVVDARNQEAVARLRERKHREEKPFALMYPSLAYAEEECDISAAEAALLLSHRSPIVLLKRLRGAGSLAPNLAPDLAPGNPNLGVMLPYTPLHHILMSELGFPVVATSGNLADEPICTDEHEALQRLGGIAELFLVHNRPIKRHVDDSVVRVLMGRAMILRRARGYAPLPVRLSCPVPTTLAVGAHLKNSVALAVGRDVFISQHIGDLETVQANEAFERVIADFEQLYDAPPARVACDAHPDYLSSQFARRTGLPVHAVQHHEAHVFACMAENGLVGDDLNRGVLGVSWDGTGYGSDGTVWGGEFLRVKGGTATRVAHLRTFPLPGGEKAVREPRRAAIGLLYEMYGDGLPTKRHLAPVQACTSQELSVWQAMMRRGVNAPLTSSVGRLFDAVASIVGLRQYAGFEGQAAMELEFAMPGVDTDKSYPFRVTDSRGASPGPIIVDWALPVLGVLLDTYFRLPVGLIAAKFHNTLAEMVVKIAQLSGETNIALTGGCFQNAYLLERTIGRLREEGFKPYWHSQVPPNDGGIALGQIVAASFALAEG